MNLTAQKSLLRKKYREERKKYRQDFPYIHLMNSPEIENAEIITSYISYGDEPNTYELNRTILESGKKLLLPRIASESHEPSLDWIYWNGDSAKLSRQGKNMEPIGSPERRLDLIDVAIVPALHIDAQGVRLGQGGGYYDHAFAQLNAWKIALIYPEEFCEELLPRESHDIAVNAYATYEKIVRFT